MAAANMLKFFGKSRPNCKFNLLACKLEQILPVTGCWRVHSTGIVTSQIPSIKRVLYKPTLDGGKQYYSTSFFNKLPSADLWKGVISVSNAGRKRGRGKGAGRKMAKDLNRGQFIGVGKENVVWPGLNAPVVRGRELIQQRQLPPDPEREANILKIRNEMSGFRPLRISPLERGWSGVKLPGRKLGPPDPVGEDVFEGFETIALEMKSVFNMDANIGRKRTMSAFVVTGNGNGLVGFGLGKAPDGKSAVRKAKNRAGQRLMYIERYKEHTVCHDFFSQFGSTKIFVFQKPEGFGLVCHRAVKNVCQMIGIKDIYAKVENSTNLQHVIKAFFLGLLRQKTHQEMADEKQLYVVERRAENDNVPIILAKPSHCRTKEEIDPTENLDYKQYLMDGKVVLFKKKPEPFYTKFPSWEIRQRKIAVFRNAEKVRVNMFLEYGKERSHLSDQYPECVGSEEYWKLRKAQKDKENAESVT